MKEGCLSRRRVVATSLAASFIAFAAQAALAQSTKAGAATAGAATPGKPHAAARSTPKKTVAPAPASTTGSGPLAPAATANGASDAGVVESKTLDGGTRVFRFSEIDIEGRLKSPQLVYFLRRVRAEFAAGDLGHRSFLGEMSETRKEPTF
jgi:hypothetical protein